MPDSRAKGRRALKISYAGDKTRRVNTGEKNSNNAPYNFSTMAYITTQRLRLVRTRESWNVSSRSHH
jgi:hypothetical protein